MAHYHRRKRKADPLANEHSVRDVCNELLEHFGDSKIRSEKDLVKFLNAVLYIETYSATDTKRGRPGKWPRQTLINASSRLTFILARETSGRVSLQSFIRFYLPILNFPKDVLEVLENGEINLQECTSPDNLLNFFTHYNEVENAYCRIVGGQL